MIGPLRKRHKLIWLIVGVVIPVSFVLILQRIPTDAFSPISNSTSPEIINSINKIDSKIEFVLSQKLRSGFSTVQLVDEKGETLTIGTLGAAGKYTFNIDSGFSAQKLIIQDAIKKEELYKTDI